MFLPAVDILVRTIASKDTVQRPLADSTVETFSVIGLSPGEHLLRMEDPVMTNLFGTLSLILRSHLTFPRILDSRPPRLQE